MGSALSVTLNVQPAQGTGLSCARLVPSEDGSTNPPARVRTI